VTSPDWSEYVDLTVYDQDATELFNEAIDYGIDTLPEWAPQSGNIEVVVLEAIATQASNVATAANRVPGAVMETLLLLYDIERNDGTKATATVDVTMINDTGYVVPADTYFAYFPAGNGQPLVYSLDEDITIAAGGSTGQGQITALEVGTEYNDPSIGATLQILSTMPYLLSSTLNTQPEGGTEPETDEEFFARATTTLRSYSAALTTAVQIESWVLVTYPNDVYRAKAYDRRRKSDRDNTSPTFDLHDGYALVVVAGFNATITDTSDVLLAVGELDIISTALDAKTNVGLVTELVNAELVDVNVEITVMPYIGYTTTQVQLAIDAAFDEYFSPNNWNWADTIRETEIIALVDNVEGVDYVDQVISVSTASANATVTGNDMAFHLLGSLPVSTTHIVNVLSPS